jgi:alpha-beta hydrolase superfamily lysophospholipase
MRPKARETGFADCGGFFALLALCMLLIGCAPTVIPRGPSVETPRIVDDWIAVMPDGAQLPLEIWQPEDFGGGEIRAVVIGLHGFGDYANAFRRFGPRLAADGVRFLAYDQRGFGEAPERGRWAGTDTLVDDALTVVRLARAQDGAHDIPVYLMGESMGGAVAMLAAARAEPGALDGIILSAPAVWGRSFMPGYQRTSLGVMIRIAPWMTVTPRGLPIRPSDNIAMLRKLGRDSLFLGSPRIDMVHGLVDLMDAAQAAASEIAIPTLMLYGGRDDLVPRAPTCAVIEQLTAQNPMARITVYRNGHHMLFRDLAGATVATDIASWALAPKGALPSGEERRPASPELAAFCNGRSERD